MLLLITFSVTVIVDELCRWLVSFSAVCKSDFVLELDYDCL